MTLSIDFTERVALVTGATRGIGLSIAEHLAEAGAKVIATGTARTEGETIAALRDRGLSIEYLALDLGDETSLRGACQFVAQLPRLDALINNAGVNHIVELHEVTAEDYDRLHRIDLRGPLLLCGAAIPVMRRNRWGRIVNIGSIWATITKPGRAMYTASKFGLVGMTKTLAIENAAYGILANAVSPGFTLTELTRSTLSEAEMARLAAQVPAQRFADPPEMAKVVAFLCSPLNTYLTAQNVIVDGGFSST